MNYTATWHLEFKYLKLCYKLQSLLEYKLQLMHFQNKYNLEMVALLLVSLFKVIVMWHSGDEGK